MDNFRRSPGTGVVNVSPRRTLTLRERLYLTEIVRGLALTTYRFWRNLAIHSLHAPPLSVIDGGAVARQPG